MKFREYLVTNIHILESDDYETNYKRIKKTIQDDPKKYTKKFVEKDLNMIIKFYKNMQKNEKKMLDLANVEKKALVQLERSATGNRLLDLRNKLHNVNKDLTKHENEIIMLKSKESDYIKIKNSILKEM